MIRFFLSLIVSLFFKAKFSHSCLSFRKSSRAFSLLELSIVLVLIGILIVSTISAKSIIKKSRIIAAQSKTRSSPVNSIPDAVIWLESSLADSFDADEAEDDSDLSVWKDIKTGSASPINNGSAGSEAPKYSNTINSIQAVKFSGSDDSYFAVDGSALNGSDYTIIVLEKRQGDDANYFLTQAGSSTTDNEVLQLGYSASGTVIHSQGSGNNYTSSVEGYNSQVQQPRIFTFIQNGSTGKKTYINGFIAGEDSDVTRLSNISDLHLGKGYTGEIGEFIIFDRALKKSERRSIEKYLLEKWRMSAITLSSNDQDCTDGQVKNSGCLAICSVSIAGVSVSSVGDGSSGDFGCSGTGYDTSDEVSYSCSSGVLSVTGSCGCTSGYELTSGAGSACIVSATCDVGSIPGSSDSNSTVNDGDVVACDQTGYVAANIETCDPGNDISGSCSCATGYSDLDSNGTCEQKCSLSSSDSGLDADINIDSGASSYDCTTYSSGIYEGTITFDSACDNGSGLSVASGVCEELLSCTATNGTTDTTSIPGETIHIFTSGGSLDCVGSNSISAQILIVAGGGSGGTASSKGGAGGGGGGGVVYYSDYTLIQNDYPIEVGSGGEAVSTNGQYGNDGENSTFNTSIIAYGGGGGGTFATSNQATNGRDGGSGGGAGSALNNSNGGSSIQVAQSGADASLGNDGGNGSAPQKYGAGGGGGAGGSGQSGTSTYNGVGGDGVSYSIIGSSVIYGAGGGGGGGRDNMSGASGGSGGIGGTGGNGYLIESNATDGDTSDGAGTRGNGGGGAPQNHISGSGSDGVVIIRY